MVNRLVVVLVTVCAGIFASVQPAAAQQTINLNLGYFVVRGEDARVDGDVMVANRSFLAFDISEFNGFTIGAEWLFPVGRYLEGGAGIGLHRRTTPSVYADFVDSDNNEIEQDLRLRVIPMSFTFRVLPLGQGPAVQPYFGAGLGIFNWRYSEVGDFIDFSTPQLVIFREQYVASGNSTGPIALGGIRFASDSFSAGYEARYQRADGALDDEFFGSRVDLGGWSHLFTIGFRFGR